MAFPTTSVIDNFNRANGALGSNWSGSVFGDTDTIVIVSNQCVNNTTGNQYAGARWNVTTFGPASEIYITIVAEGTASGGCELLLRCSSGSNPNAYSLFGNHDGGSSWTINRYDAGTFTQLGASFTQAISAGDSVGFDANGSTLAAHYKAAAGSWGAMGTTRTDATYSGAGYLAFEWQDSSNSNGHQGDDFGGGTVSAGGAAVIPFVALAPHRAP